MPSGATATKVCAAKDWSSWKALSAAFCPVGAAVGEHDPGRGVGPVPYEAAHDPHVFGAERRPARGDGAFHARQLGGHHVRVAFDHDDPALAGDGPPGHVQPVEDLRFPVDRRLGGVEVLRAAVLLAQAPRAEAYRVARHRGDRPHETAAEAIVETPVPPARQTGGGYLPLRESVAAQLGQQAVPGGGRVADPVPGEGLLVESPLGEHPPPRLGLVARQVPDVEVEGDAVGVDEPVAGGAVRAPLGHPDLARQELDGLDERDALDPLDEGDDVAPLAATEAVPAPHARTDVEGRGLLVVEGAQALVGVGPRRAQGNVLGDDVLDARSRTDLVDVLTPDETRHEDDSTAAHPGGPAGRRRSGPAAAPGARASGRRTVAVPWPRRTGAGPGRLSS